MASNANGASNHAQKDALARTKRWWFGILTKSVFVTCVAVYVATELTGLDALIHTWRRLPYSAHHLLATYPLVDAHADVPMAIAEKLAGDVSKFKLNTSALGTHVDMPRMRAGRVASMVMAAYVPCGNASIKETHAMMQLVRDIADADDENVVIAKTASDVRLAHATRRVALVMGVEGLHAFEDETRTPVEESIRNARRLGARVITLNHNCHTAVTDSCCADAQPAKSDGGDGSRGLHRPEVLLLLNDLGLVVDLSHASVAAAADVLRLSRAPVIFSHSGAYELCEHPRNVPSNLLPLVRANGGLVMVPFHPPFLCGDSVLAVVEHISFLARHLGIRHVGLGSDYDGIPKGVRGLHTGVDAYPVLVDALLERFSPSDVALVIGGNFLRVWDNVLRQASTAV
ncbi:membrane dipeptidase [Pycnococcus provasolii]